MGGPNEAITAEREVILTLSGTSVAAHPPCGGNRLLKVHDGARTTYSYDVVNQLEWSEDASGRTTYTFDADGNQQRVLEPNGDRTTISWDYENRTTLVQLPSGIRNTMAYEPGGLRVKLEESAGTKKFVWDEQNYLAETDANDDTQVVYTNEPRVYGNLVSQRRGSDSHWYHFDARHSTREVSDGSETTSDSFLYDAWGQIVASQVGSALVFRWTGELGYGSDVETGSVYVRRRLYLPSNGRWSSLDPLFFRAGPNGFVYVQNNPVILFDPSGLSDLREVCCIQETLFGSDTFEDPDTLHPDEAQYITVRCPVGVPTLSCCARADFGGSRGRTRVRAQDGPCETDGTFAFLDSCEPLGGTLPVFPGGPLIGIGSRLGWIATACEQVATKPQVVTVAAGTVCLVTTAICRLPWPWTEPQPKPDDEPVGGPIGTDVDDSGRHHCCRYDCVAFEVEVQKSIQHDCKDSVIRWNEGTRYDCDLVLDYPGECKGGRWVWPSQ